MRMCEAVRYKLFAMDGEAALSWLYFRKIRNGAGETIGMGMYHKNKADNGEWIEARLRHTHPNDQRKWFIKSYLDGSVVVNTSSMYEFQRGNKYEIMAVVTEKCGPRMDKIGEIDIYRRKPLWLEYSQGDTYDFFSHLSKKFGTVMVAQ